MKPPCHSALITVLRSLSTLRGQLTRAKCQAQTMQELAHRGPLTRLSNRRALERDLGQAVAASGAHWRLAIVDVDGVKEATKFRGLKVYEPNGLLICGVHGVK